MKTLVQCFALGACAWLGVSAAVEACSRVVHRSEDGKFVVTGRSMDWMEDIESNLWVFPRGMERDGAVKENAHVWKSLYGSVITAGFDMGTSDGLNEKGLVVNLLYLAEADYGPRDTTRPGISWSAYTQYLLDTYATVAEAVEGERKKNLQIVTSAIPGTSGKPPSLHFSLSDATADSAIFEFLEGKLVIHHGNAFNVMTNSPIYDQQLALNAYWQTVNGEAMLPGTRRAADRFVRASFYESKLPDPKSQREAVAHVLSVVRNVSAPFGQADPNQPNISATIWRTVGDNVNKVYYFESTRAPGVVWVKLGEVDLSPGQPTRKLDLVNHPDLSGDLTKLLKAAEPFKFVGTR